MSETVTMVWQPAPENTRYAPGCFDSSIGKRVPFKVNGVRAASCKLLAAEVVDEGAAVLLTLELPETVRRELECGAVGQSFSIAEPPSPQHPGA